VNSICIFSYDFTQMGGAERASANLANELVKSNKVVLISLCNKAKSFAYKLDDRIKTYRIVEGERSLSAIILKSVIAFRKILQKESIASVVCMDTITPLVVFIGSSFTNIKFIACERTYYNRPIYDEILVYKIGAWIRAHKSDIVQVLTEENRRGLAEKYGIPLNKIVTIPNWINENAIRGNAYNHNMKRIISVGRASPEKNYEGLIEVAKKIKPRVTGWEWHIWGRFDNDYGQEILKKIKDEGMDDFIVYKGVTDSIFDVYKNYSLFVMTSQYEGMPNVMLEAKGSKLPLVAYDCKTGPSELIMDGKNGFLVPLNNVELMSEKIWSLINNRELAESFSSNWDYGIERYIKSNVMKKWNEILEVK